MPANHSYKQLYHDYIAVLNRNEAFIRSNAAGLQAYVHDYVTHNGRQMTCDEYIDMIIDAKSAIRDLEFVINMITSDEVNEQVGARVSLRGRLEQPFLGFEPPPGGKFVEYYEHVFYQWRHDRIIEVWCVVDEASLKRQLEA